MKSLKIWLVICVVCLLTLASGQNPIKQDTTKCEVVIKEQRIQMDQMKIQFAKLDSVMKARNIKIDTTKHK